MFRKNAGKILGPIIGAALSLPEIVSAGQRGSTGDNLLGATGIAGAATGALDATAQDLMMKDLAEYIGKHTVGSAYDFLGDSFLPKGKYANERKHDEYYRDAMNGLK